MLSVWRRRTSTYLRAVDPQARAILRLLPVLLGARFRRPGLDREPPGIKRMPRRRRWGRLCERVELPPPLSFAGGAPLVQSIVVVPRNDQSHDVLIFTVGVLTPSDALRLNERVASIAILLDRRAPKLFLRVATPNEFTPAVAALAAVVAGDLPPSISGSFDLSELLARAHTPRARLLALLAAHTKTPFEEALVPTAWLRDASIDGALARWSNDDAARELLLITAIDPISPAQLLLTADHLRRARARVLRKIPALTRAQVRPRLHHSLESRIPQVLKPLLLEVLKAHPATEVQRDNKWECRLGESVLVRARSLDQLRARAICESTTLTAEGSEWRRVSGLVAQGHSRRVVVLVQPEFVKHLFVIIGPSLKPRAQRLDTLHLTEQCLAIRSQGYSLEVMAAPGCDKPLVSRLSRLASLATEGHEVGLQLGERILIAKNGRTRNRPLALALAHPRRLRWLPEQADWSAAFRQPMQSRFSSVQATVWPKNDTHATLLAVDQAGLMFHELLEVDRLEITLQEMRALLSPTSFSASVSPALEQLTGRRAPAEVPAVLVDVECDWPWRLTLSFEGERFGYGGTLPWVAAAETVLSRWPPGVEGRIGVRSITWRRQPTDMSPLHLLAIRSRVLRRLGAQLGRLARHMLAA
jgi:hypothetical protein